MAITPSKLLYLITLYLPVCCQATNDVTITNWRRLTPYDVTTYELRMEVRSKVECMKECLKYSHCSRIAYQSAASLCFLQPHQPQSPSTGNGVVIYENQEAICSTAEAPVNDATVTWKRSLTSLTGDVKCVNHYLLALGSGVVTCDASNKWYSGGQCIQHMWTSFGKADYFPVPLKMTVGWKMCIRGARMPNADKLFISLLDQDGNRPMKIIFFFTVNGVSKLETKFSTYKNGVFSNQEVLPRANFPLYEGMAFTIDILAVSINRMEVYVDSELFHSYETVLPTLSIIKARFSNIHLQILDMWCQMHA